MKSLVIAFSLYAILSILFIALLAINLSVKSNRDFKIYQDMIDNMKDGSKKCH